MSKIRQYRRRRGSEEESEEPEKSTGEDETPVSKTLLETREAQKHRRRPAGVSAVGLAFGKKFTDEEALAPDPFKLKTGGLVDMKDTKTSDTQGADDEVVKLSANFSAETKKLDNEEHMLDYIEKEMAKRKPVATDGDTDISSYDQKIKALYQIPEHLQVKKKEESEEMLSNQMLSGIPEVDLGLEARFSNIEETEQARQKQFKQRSSKPGEAANKNFTLHSLRFHRANKEPHLREGKEVVVGPAKPAFIPVVGENEPELVPTGQGAENKRKKKIEQAQMATDDYHYDRFRKKTRMF